MSLWKKSKSRKLQSLVMASILALSVNLGVVNHASALTFSNIDLNNKFIIDVSYGNPDSYETHVNLYAGYLVYTPTDMPIYSSYNQYSGQTSEPIGTLKGGKLYFIYQHSTISNGQLDFVKDGILIADSDHDLGRWTTVTDMGNAADIFGEGGMSEEDIKDLIDDAIHNVDGDQTVDGNQQVTGDQQVDGEQTVKSATSM